MALLFVLVHVGLKGEAFGNVVLAQQDWPRHSTAVFRGTAAPGAPAMIEANEFKQTVSAEFTARLVSLGFEAFRGHKWVLSVTAPIRRVFALYNLKSLSLVPVWGFSFDFVPHLGAGDEVKWHRTARSAFLDLSYDPLDYTSNVHEWAVSRFDRLDEVRERAKYVSSRAVADAITFWDRVRTLENAADLFRDWRARPYVRFGFENYVQAPLAFAFVLARLGQADEARAWLERCFRNHVRSEAKRKLRGLLRVAINGGTG